MNSGEELANDNEQNNNDPFKLLDSQIGRLRKIAEEPAKGFVFDSPDPQGNPDLMQNEDQFEPLEFDVNAGTQDNPIKTSTLTAGQRGALSFGNPSGRIKFLKENFQDARMTKDGDLVYKDRGLWFQADATGNDPNPFKTSNSIMDSEFVKDIADLGDETLQIGLPIVTSLLGRRGQKAAPAVALFGTFTKHHLGRRLGTSDASDLEIAADMALESALMAGGYAVFAGSKIALSKVPGLKEGLLKAGIKAVDSVPNAGRAFDAIKEGAKKGLRVPLQSVMRYAGASERASEKIFIYPEIGPMIKSSVSKIGKPGKAGNIITELDVMDDLARKGGKELQALGSTARNELNKNMDSLWDVVTDEAIKSGKMQFNYAGAVTDTLQAMQRSGIIEPAKIAARNGKQVVTSWRVVKDLANSVTDSSIAAELVAPGVRTNLNKLVTVLNTISNTSKGGTLRGRAAVQSIRDMRTQLGKLAFKATKGADNSRLRGQVGQIIEALDAQATEAFQRSGSRTAEAFGRTRAYWRTHVDGVAELQKATASPAGRASAASQLYAPGGQSNRLKEIVGDLFAPQGGLNTFEGLATKGPPPLSDAVLRQVDSTLSARDFIRVMPKPGLAGGAQRLAGQFANIATLGALSPRMQARFARLAMRVGPQRASQEMNSVQATAVKDMMQASKNNLLTSPDKATLFSLIFTRTMQQLQLMTQMQQSILEQANGQQ